MKKTIDELDRNILFEIRHGANKPLRELSEKLKCPISTIKERIDRMESFGIIEGYNACINYPLLNYFCFGLISIKLDSKYVNEKQVIEKIRDIPEVASLFRVLGSFDVYAGIIVPNIDMAIEVVKKIYSVEGVQKAETQIALTALKSSIDYNPIFLEKR